MILVAFVSFHIPFWAVPFSPSQYDGAVIRGLSERFRSPQANMMVLWLGVWGFEVEIPRRGPDSNIGLVKFPYVSLYPASEQSFQPSPYSNSSHTNKARKVP